MSRVPTPQGKWPKIFHPRKHREFGNSAKTLEIGFAQVVNSLIRKVKGILIFAAKISKSAKTVFFFPALGVRYKQLLWHAWLP